MARRSRRRFLQVSLAGFAAGLAGCGMPDGGEGGEGGEENGEEGDEGGESGEEDEESDALGGGGDEGG